MNHILHNISLIILCLGILLMTIYVTKSYNNQNYTKQDIVQQNNPREEPITDDVYTQRPATIYKDMFLQNSSWLNKYQNIDNVASQNLYL